MSYDPKDNPLNRVKVEGYVEGCSHECTSNCRREGCNCECGEYHEIDF